MTERDCEGRFVKGCESMIKGRRKYVKTCPKCKEEFGTSNKRIRYCSSECSERFKRTIYMKDCKGCSETFSTLDKRQRYCSKPCGIHNRKHWNEGNKGFLAGEKHYNWQGGITNLYYQLRNSFKYKEWRLQVFERDLFICQRCGDDKGGNLEAHHKNSFSKILHENKIKSLKDAETCKSLWEVKNGVTLCDKCHCKIDKFREKWGVKSVK